MLLKANPGSTRVIMESDKNHFGCYLREKSQLHGEVVWPLEECFLEGRRVVGLEGDCLCRDGRRGKSGRENGYGPRRGRWQGALPGAGAFVRLLWVEREIRELLERKSEKRVHLFWRSWREEPEEK